MKANESDDGPQPQAAGFQGRLAAERPSRDALGEFHD